MACWSRSRSRSTTSAAGHLPAEITPSRTDRGSSPCSMRLRRHPRTPPPHRRSRRLPQERGLRVRAENEVDTGADPLLFTGRPIARATNTPSEAASHFMFVLVLRRFTKKSLVSVPGRPVKIPMSRSSVRRRMSCYNDRIRRPASSSISLIHAPCITSPCIVPPACRMRPVISCIALRTSGWSGWPG
jgi:hypothetical protein